MKISKILPTKFKRWLKKIIFQNIFIKTKKAKEANERVNTTITKTDNIKLAFVISYLEVWNSLDGVYLEALRRQIETVVLYCPHKGANKEQATKFFEDKNIKFIDTTLINFDLEKWGPTYVIYSRPYNNEYPEYLKNYTVSKYSKTMLIPYGFTMLNNIVFDVVFKYAFLDYTNVIVSQSNNMCNDLIKKFGKLYFKKRVLLNAGFTRFDMDYSKYKSAYDSKFVVSWFPRFVFDKDGDQKKSHFFDYHKKFIDFAEKNKDIYFIWRPHPLMFDSIRKDNLMEEVELDGLLEKIERMENVEIDKRSDYAYTLSVSDVMVTDFTSLLMEYFMLNKPVIYCDTKDGFNKDSKTISSAIAYSKNWNGIEKQIVDIKNGIDKYSSKRKKIIDNYKSDSNGSASKNIIDFIVKQNGI